MYMYTSWYFYKIKCIVQLYDARLTDIVWQMYKKKDLTHMHIKPCSLSIQFEQFISIQVDKQLSAGLPILAFKKTIRIR